MLSADPRPLGHVPALDGLRAFAIALVMFAHANFLLFENGAVGVPVFFALSGFLITTLLLEEHQRYNTISFKAFYIRRTFRLFPALYATLLAVLVYVWVFNPTLKSEVYHEVVAAALYVYNLDWLLGVEHVMLYHTWSLAVEEQFYLLWPALFYVFLRKDKLKALAITLGVLVVFFLISGVMQLQKGNQAFRIMDSIISESIFLGCVAAIVRWRGWITFRIPTSMAVLSFLVIVAIANFPPRVIGSFGQNRLAGIFSVTIILFLMQDKKNFLTTVLSNDAVAFVGKISYGLYLWHLPVFKIFALHSTLPPRVTFISKFLVSFLVAILSWYLLEKPATAFGRRLSRRILDKTHIPP